MLYFLHLKGEIMIAAVVAADENFAIGNRGDMLVSIRGDLKMFRELTTGHTVVMGRKTFDALPFGPLPKRRNIVISSKAQDGMQEAEHENGRYTLCSLEKAKEMLSSCGDETIFVIGGGVIYRELLSLCQRIYLTKIHKAFEKADTYFPNIDAMDAWRMTSCSDVQCENGLEYQFCIYEK